MAEVGIERRRTPRAEVHLPMRLSLRGDAQPAILKNLSTTGLCCHSAEAMNEFTLLAIDLELPGPPKPARVQVQGAVVRCAKLPDKSPATYELGVYFTEISSEARSAVAGFVSGRLGGQDEAKLASR